MTTVLMCVFACAVFVVGGVLYTIWIDRIVDKWLKGFDRKDAA